MKGKANHDTIGRSPHEAIRLEVRIYLCIKEVVHCLKHLMSTVCDLFSYRLFLYICAF